MGRKGKVGCADAVPKTEYAMKQGKVKAVCSEKLHVRFVRGGYGRSRKGRPASTLQESVDVSLPGGRFRGEHARVSLESDARCRGRQTLLCQSAALQGWFSSSSAS